MDSALAAESTEQTKSCPDVAVDPVVADDKRPPPTEVGEFGARTKRMRSAASEEDIRRIAEIVLVLSAMGAMRGGRDPTDPEKEMMAEARSIAVSVCEDFAPMDIIPREAFAEVIEDLGLKRLKDQRSGFRPPKLSIADKLELSKRKMVESKSFAPQAAIDSTQRAQAGVENCGTPTAVHTISSDKATNIQASAGAFQHISPTAQVSSASSTILYFQPPSNVRASVLSTEQSTSNLGKDSSSTISRVEGQHLKSDGRVRGTSQAQHVASGFTVKTTAALQPRPILSSNISMKTKPPEQSSVKFEGNTNLNAPQLNSHPTNAQTYSPVITQTVPGSLPSMRHPIQGMQFVHSAPHLEISKKVQKLLYPKPLECPTWSPPSRDYMNKSVSCQMCKLAMNEVDHMLVCDVCEKGFHLKCLLSSNQKFVPRGEWYCPRCITISGGKPFPPKYGRVTRNFATKISSSGAGVQSPPEKKVEAQDQNSNQQKIVAKGELEETNGPHGGLVDVSSVANTIQTNKIHGSEISIATEKDELSNSETCADKNSASLEASHVSSSAGSLENGPTQHVVDPEASLYDDKVKSQVKDCTSAYTSGFDGSKELSPSRSPTCAHDTEAFSTGVFPEQNDDASQLHNHSDKSDGTKVDDGNTTCNFKEDDQYEGQEKQIGSAGVSTDLRDSAKGTEGLHHVEWIGDVHEVMENKKFYLSCHINGVVYKLQDYALIQSTNGQLIPWKIQAMWEDSQTGSRWVAVNRCYFPGDLPATVGRPSSPDANEVYESNDESTLLAGLIERPCIILPAKKFGETDQIGDEQSDGGRPIFSCRWFYDKIKCVFRPVPSLRFS